MILSKGRGRTGGWVIFVMKTDQGATCKTAIITSLLQKAVLKLKMNLLLVKYLYVASSLPNFFWSFFLYQIVTTTGGCQGNNISPINFLNESFQDNTMETSLG